MKTPEHDLILSNGEGKIQTIFSKRRKDFIDVCRKQRRAGYD